MFSIYDENDHLVPIDSGLIEANQRLYLSGYVKPLYSTQTITETGLATKDIGPILGWYVCGYEGGDKVHIGITTKYAEYYLSTPNGKYYPFMRRMKEKTYITKAVLDFLLAVAWKSPTYEDLLSHLYNIVTPSFMGSITEEHLLLHANFICDQVCKNLVLKKNELLDM